MHQTTTGLTPFQCFLGFQPPLFLWSGEPSEVPSVNYWFRESERVWNDAHRHLQQAIRRHKRFADTRRNDTPTFEPGQLVWLSTRDIRLRQPCRKLSPRYIGPFKILHQINPVTYKLLLPPHLKIHPVFHVSLLKPHYPSILPPTTEPDPDHTPSIPTIEEDPIYFVHEILDSRRWGGRLEYLVDWEGYGPEERSWVLRDDILVPALFTEFHQQHPHRPAPRPRGRPPRRRGPRSAGADPGGGGGGVMSGINQAHLHPQHKDHTHLNTNHLHLPSISNPTITEHYKGTHFTSIPCRTLN